MPDAPRRPALSEADRPEHRAGHVVRLGAEAPLRLDCGAELADFPVAYQTYGRLNGARSNTVVLAHALTGDQFAAEPHPVTGRGGWWELMVGPGKPIDTERYFVLCANVLGGCMGTAGPRETNPATNRPYALDFPMVTVADMVRAQAMLLDHLGIDRILCVTGGSMGGMQVLEWMASYPERTFSALPIACAAHHTAQNIALHEVGRQAILWDPAWRGGHYLVEGTNPAGGLAVARMVGHISYLSEAALHRKFGRRLQDRDSLSFGFEADFQVESYLRHQGSIFVDRFDANSYLYLTRAMDYFDLIAEHGGVLADAFRGCTTRVCSISFTGDWLFPTAENLAIVRALTQVGADVSFVEIESDKGHDAFLLDEPELFATVRGFLADAAARRGVAEA